MFRKIIIAIFGVGLGVLAGYLLLFYSQAKPVIEIPGIPVKKSMGFLPYWLLNKAKHDYSQYLNGIYYFGLTIGSDGKLVEFANSQEKEPDWYALESGKVDPFLKKAKENNQTLSLVVFSGDQSSIGELIKNPAEHAVNLVSDVFPVMRKYGFTDLNLDVEYMDTASEEARMNFTRFVKGIKMAMNSQSLGTLSIDISPTAFIKDYLVDPKAISEYVDSIVIMGYDYHFPGSYVAGPVAPLYGAGSISEFDIQTAIEKALSILPARKIILGIPLYGYEWETIGDTERSPVIPGSGLTASGKRIEELLGSCADCKIQYDSVSMEKYLIYKDPDTGSYHQIFYPDQEAMSEKIKFAKKHNLGGIALWALGYEDSTILDPLKNY